MSEALSRSTGSALMWRGVQLALVQIVSLARTLILARLLVPEDFGLMAIALVTLNTLLNLTDIGLLPALVQRADVEPRQYDAAWTLGLVRSLFLGGAIALAAPWIAVVFGVAAAAPIIRALALRPVIESAASIRMAELMRAMNFRSLAVVHLTAACVDAVVAISLARRFGVWALVAGALASATAIAATSYVAAPHRPRLLFDRLASRPLLRFGRWIFVTGVLTTLGSTVLQMIISRQLGAAALGIYFLAVKLAFLPGLVSSKVAGDVAFPMFARLQHERDTAARAFRTLLTGLSALLVPGYVLLAVVAPSLVSDVLGPRWEPTVPLLRILAVVGILALFRDSLVPALKGLGRPSRVALLEGLQSLLLIAIGWALSSALGLPGAAAAWLPAVFVAQLVAANSLRRLVPRPYAGLSAPLLAIGAIALGAGGLAYAVDRAVPGLAGLVAALALAAAATAVLTIAADRAMSLGLADAVARAFPQLARPIERLTKRTGSTGPVQ